MTTDSRDVPAPGARDTREASGSDVNGVAVYDLERHAVIIGVNRYQDPSIPDLSFAAADARSLFGVLTDPAIGHFSPENVDLLLDDEATEHNIETAIATKLPARAGPDSLVVVFFAGHGAPAIDPTGRSKDGMEKYFVPHEGELENLRATGVSMDMVQRFMGFIEARQVLFFIDSCYSGVAGGRTFADPRYSTRATLSDEFLDQLAGNGRLVVTACGVNEVALEIQDDGHGLFTYYLVEGLRGAADTEGRGFVTASDLYDYVYSGVSNRARSLGGSMHPVLKSSLQGAVYLTGVTPKDGAVTKGRFPLGQRSRRTRDNDRHPLVSWIGSAIERNVLLAAVLVVATVLVVVGLIYLIILFVGPFFGG